VSVSFNGIPAAIQSVAPTGAFPFINAQVPFGVATGGPANMVVSVNGVASEVKPVPMTAAAPGVFTHSTDRTRNRHSVLSGPFGQSRQDRSAYFGEHWISNRADSARDGSRHLCHRIGALSPAEADGDGDTGTTHFAVALPTVKIGGVAVTRVRGTSSVLSRSESDQPDDSGERAYRQCRVAADSDRRREHHQHPRRYHRD